jgi:serine/threonine protein kinase
MIALGDGRFELKGTLGEGGAGTVFRAFDRELQREVALKLLRQASGRDLFRFKREFRALADITHPNLVALHELRAHGDQWFFTMELVEGASFIDWVRPPRHIAGPGRTRQDIAASPYNDARLRGALIQLVDALIALHRAEGRQIYIVSSSPEEVVRPLARHFGVKGVIATRAFVDPDQT